MASIILFLKYSITERQWCCTVNSPVSPSVITTAWQRNLWRVGAASWPGHHCVTRYRHWFINRGTLWGSNNTDLLFSLVLNILPLPFSFSKIGPACVLSVPSNPSKACVEMGINIDAGWQTEESSHTGARSTAGPHSEAAAGDGMKNDATVAADTGDGPDKQILELSTGLHEISQCLCGQAS